jgi:glutamate 5-kinase
MATRVIVVKIGTGSITTDEGKLDEDAMSSLSDQIIRATKHGSRIVLVSSGAVGAGIAELEIRPNPNDLVLRQASAAAGQSVLMAKYRDLFKKGGLKVAQILLTAEDLSNRKSYLHTCNVLKMLLKLGVIPIINENDVTSVDELMPLAHGYRVNFSDNDILSALVANAIKADLLMILSDVDGLFTKHPQDPDSALIKTVDRITPELKRSLSGKGRFGRGGIQSKIRAAEIAVKSGIPVVIANSRRKDVIMDILAGENVGTCFSPEKHMPAFKRWVAYGASVKGQIVVNEGAKEAILKKSSLLPVGVTRVIGQFNPGDVVGIVGQDEVEFAKGNPNYSSEEIDKIKGLRALEIEKRLGLSKPKEVIGRKKMHLIAE